MDGHKKCNFNQPFTYSSDHKPIFTPKHIIVASASEPTKKNAAQTRETLK